jgi:hypothetical protein
MTHDQPPLYDLLFLKVTLCQLRRIACDFVIMHYENIRLITEIMLRCLSITWLSRLKKFVKYIGQCGHSADLKSSGEHKDQRLPRDVSAAHFRRKHHS